MEDKLFEMGLPSLIALGFVLFFSVILKFANEIKDSFKYIWKFFQKPAIEPTASELLAEVKKLRGVIETLQTTIDAQRTHIDKIESYLEKNKELIELVEKILEHPARIYIDSLGLSIGFSDTLRPREDEDLEDMLLLFKKLVSSFPFANRKLSFELVDVRAINSKSLSSIGNIFSQIAQDNDMKLRVILPKKAIFEKLVKSLQTLRDLKNSDNVEIKEVG
ncbi:MAG: hypothetical protein HS129_15145 [Leptospiraceae bacterium]|nr:hypothetical protein [Leptospiraceae bacterium]NUM41340.1 hypothetical protein [Leptospiraceae bacterium]